MELVGVGLKWLFGENIIFYSDQETVVDYRIALEKLGIRLDDLHYFLEVCVSDKHLIVGAEKI